MKTHPRTACLAILVASSSLPAQTYLVGDVVQDYTMTDYRNGQSTTLYELGAGGGVLVLEWFAWWCPFCANAAANVETGIVEYYAQREGNPHGLPVSHIALNVQGGARSQSDTFIAKYNLGVVLEDYSRAFFNLFSPGGGQPLFVIINAEPDSPTARRWEVLYTRLNYSSGAAPDISALMRPVIDSVQPGPSGNPVAEFFPGISGPVDGWYESPWFGWFNGVAFPYVYHLEFGYIFLTDGPADNLFLRNEAFGWLFSGPQFYPYLFSYSTSNWLYYLRGTNGEWLFDYSLNQWRQF